jgi:hypothetical protein
MRLDNRLLGAFGLLLGHAQTASANVEKTIFTAPDAISLPTKSPSLNDLSLAVITPGNWSLRTQITTSTPGTSLPDAKATWLLLDELQFGRRYEVRVCWAATVSQTLLPRNMTSFLYCGTL